MKPRDAVLAQIGHRETSPIPYSLEMEEVVARRLDDHYGTPDWRKRLAPYIRVIAYIDTVKMENVDAKFGRDAYGGIWELDKRPWHLHEPPIAQPSFRGCAFPSSEAFRQPDFQQKAAQELEAHSESFSVVSVGWGLFEQSWRLLGFENALLYSISEPSFYEEVLDRLADLYLDFIGWCAGIPADAVMFGDDWGDQRGVILGPERWRRFVRPRWERIYRAVHDQGKIVISHCCGSIADIMADVIDMGLDVLESVQPEAAGMSPYALKKRWGGDITFYGGLGSQSTIPFGTPEEIREEVGRLCREMGRGGGYILHPAKELQPETPAENAAAVLEAFVDQEAAVRAFSARP